MGMYNNTNYDYLIKINPSRSEGVFITNIDKNSDRKRISLILIIRLLKDTIRRL